MTFVRLDFLCLAVWSFVTFSVKGFEVLRPWRGAMRTLLHSTKENLTGEILVKAALDATRQHGTLSNEARVLWDAVEEMRGADNSEAMMGNSFDDDCLLDENGVNEACLEYHQKMAELIQLMHKYEDWRDLVAEQHMFDNFKALTEELREIKIRVNTASSNVHPDSPAFQAALSKAIEEAKEMTANNGITSIEARLAWETVEEIASAGLDNAMGVGLLDEECLVEQASDACRALEKFNKALKYKDNQY